MNINTVSIKKFEKIPLINDLLNNYPNNSDELIKNHIINTFGSLRVLELYLYFNDENINIGDITLNDIKNYIFFIDYSNMPNEYKNILSYINNENIIYLNDVFDKLLNIDDLLILLPYNLFIKYNNYQNYIILWVKNNVDFVIKNREKLTSSDFLQDFIVLYNKHNNHKYYKINDKVITNFDIMKFVTTDIKSKDNILHDLIEAIIMDNMFITKYIHYIVINNYSVEFLIFSVDVELILISIIYNNLDIFKYFISSNVYPHYKNIPIIEAAKYGRVEMFKILIENSAQLPLIHFINIQKNPTPQQLEIINFMKNSVLPNFQNYEHYEQFANQNKKYIRDTKFFDRTHINEENITEKDIMDGGIFDINDINNNDIDIQNILNNFDDFVLDENNNGL